jgi:hypothetical protein
VQKNIEVPKHNKLGWKLFISESFTKVPCFDHDTRPLTRITKPVDYKLTNANNAHHQSRWINSTLAFNNSPDTFTAAFSPGLIARGTERKIPFLPITVGKLRQHP